VLPYLDAVELIILLGTEVGVKGRDLAPQACDRLREARSLLREHAKPGVRLVADGAIRTHTVPVSYTRPARTPSCRDRWSSNPLT
jgi:ribulose-phosphate 3-epimerase